MSEANKYGLSRYIPSDIKREIRKNSGFGCVICGLAITQYEHIDPEFSEATKHDPEKMTCLCGSCHDKVTRKIWSKQKVERHAKKPKCLEDGYSSDFFDIGVNIPKVIFGDTEWIDTPTIIEAFGKTILGFTIDKYSEMLEVSGIFHDDLDNEIFKIERNEWKGATSNYDIEVVGNTLTIRKQHRQIALSITVESPSSFIINKIDMLFQGAVIRGEQKKGFEAIAPDGSKIMLSGMKAEGCVSGITITENSVGLGYKCKKLCL